MKLKPIPTNTVVHTPTEAEAKELLDILHENGYRWNMGDSIINHTKWHGASSAYHIYPDENVITWNYRIDDGAITLADFKRLYCENEKPQLKFKVGDKVIVKEDWVINTPLKVEKYDEADNVYKLEGLPIIWLNESQLEPYTEPETKPTEDMETKEEKSEISINLCEQPEEPEAKELNLCELLRNCEEGERFYSLLYGETQLRKVGHECLEIATGDGKYWTSISSDGTFAEGGNVVLYPSRALYEQYPLDAAKAWMKWKEGQKKFGLDIKIETYFEGKFGWEDCDDNESCLHFRTPADRNKCIEEIQEVINKYQTNVPRIAKES